MLGCPPHLEHKAPSQVRYRAALLPDDEVIVTAPFF
jgi:hypothetical protein